MLLDPLHIAVHPALQELAAGGSNASVGFEQPLLCLNVDLGLAERRHVKVGQDRSKMLLRDSRANGSD